MKIYQKVFFSIINDLEFLRGLDLNNFKNSGELLNWLISNFVNTLHDNKIYISEVTSTPINIQNENINLYLEITLPDSNFSIVNSELSFKLSKDKQFKILFINSSVGLILKS